MEKNNTEILTPRQLETMNNILKIGGDRPYSRKGIDMEIKEVILSEIGHKLNLVRDKNINLTKFDLSQISRCEGLFMSIKSKGKSQVTSNLIIGQVTHKALQIMYNTDQDNVEELVKMSIRGIRAENSEINEYINKEGSYLLSDVISTSVNKIETFRNDWPKLERSWVPRFEESIVAKIEKLSLSGRADLIIGRPRPDLKRTMMLIDIKSGSINEDHKEEALFYALITTLRHGVMPWRSLVYSLASGEYTDLDFSENELLDYALKLGKQVSSYLNVMYELDEIKLSYGKHCNYCPIKNDCNEYKKNSDSL